MGDDFPFLAAMFKERRATGASPIRRTPIAALMGIDDPAALVPVRFGERVIVGKEENSKLLGADEMPKMWMLRQSFGLGIRYSLLRRN
jgi:hypothetical protein